jgi:hypothetical protein
MEFPDTPVIARGWATGRDPEVRVDPDLVPSNKDLALLGSQPDLHIQIRGVDQIPEGNGVGFASGFQFHVTHILSGAFQQPCRVVQMCTVEKAYIGMTLEDIDVGERCIFHARDGASVVHQLQNVLAACADSPEPCARYGGQRICPVQPLIDDGVTLPCAG